MNVAAYISSALNGRVAVGTGGYSGIGLATARRSIADGAPVFIVSCRQADFDAGVAEVGRGIEAGRCDIGKLAEFEAVRHRAGRIDVRVANAGEGSRGRRRSS
jgi:NAD(P)-dependent dehydrogenase (short-subunit alcohol dehydrogenase family)